MVDLAAVYEDTRRSIVSLLGERPIEDLEKPVPATPGWRVRDVVAHLVGDVDCILRAEFPREFFAAIADPSEIVKLNEWTDGHRSRRAHNSLEELVTEWDSKMPTFLEMMRGERPWPDGVPFFVGHVGVTDLGVHQQDLYGAFGLRRDREGSPVKIGISTYIVGVDTRLRTDDKPVIAIEVPDKRWVAGGDGDPKATLRIGRFELFRALSGRRSMDQLRAYDWDGDPEPFLPYFYPYGVREEPLIE